MSRRLLRTLATGVLLATPFAAAAAWSCHAAALAAWAAFTLPPPALAAAEWQDPVRLLEVRRQIQKHFLDRSAHQIYLPLEDIVALTPHELESGSEAALLMQKACGHGKLFIWIPFKFKLPVTGEKVLEWCWKPRTKDV